MSVSVSVVTATSGGPGPSAAATTASSGTLHHQQQKQHHRRQVFNWLDDVSLSHLFDKFLENGYEDLELCTKIGESDLNAIGIADLRERIALLQAVRQLQHELQLQFQLHQQRTSGFPKVSASSTSSFLKALSPTRRKIPDGVTSTSTSTSRPSSRLGGTWVSGAGSHEEVELQDLRRFQHFRESTVAPSPQQQSFLHHQQNSWRNNGDLEQHQQHQSLLLLGRRTSSGPPSSPFHHHRSPYVSSSADDIHEHDIDSHLAAVDVVDDDNGDYSECNDFDLILSAQRACSSNNNFHAHQQQQLQQLLQLQHHQPSTATATSRHESQRDYPAVFLEQCNSCDCLNGLYGATATGGSHCPFHSTTETHQGGEEPFYESVSPLPPTSQQQTPHHHPHHRHRHPSSGTNKKQQQQQHVNYPVPPLPLNYGGGGGVTPINSAAVSEDNSTLSSCSGGGASSASVSASGGGGGVFSSAGNNCATQSRENFIVLRTQLRDHIIQDGINFSRIPDEMTLRAMAAKYANELSGPSVSNGQGTGNSSNPQPSSASRSTISPTTSATATATSSNSTCSSVNSGNSGGNWTIGQGLPLLEFQQQVMYQLREIWLEERRKLQLPNPNNGLTPMTMMTMSKNDYNNPEFLQFGGPDHPNNALVPGYFGSSSPPSHHGHHRTPAKQQQQLPPEQRHQYLEPVIITNSPSSSKHHQNSNQILKYQPPPPIIATISGFGDRGGGGGGGDGRQTYNPGIYQPSSCLRDKDEIYDYVPPRQSFSSKHLRQISPLSKRTGNRLQPTLSLGTMRHQNHSKYYLSSSSNNETSKTLLHHHHGGGGGAHHQQKDKTYGFFRELSQTSPRRNNHNLSTIRLLRSGGGAGAGGGTTISSGPGNKAGLPTSTSNAIGSGPVLPASSTRPTSSSMSSYTISGSCSSSNSNNSNGTSSSNSNNAYGFTNFNHIGTLTSEIEDYSQSPGANSGCRTLANLSKLSRRLGLSRFFRPSRHQQSHHRHHHHHHQYHSASANSSGGGSGGGGAVETATPPPLTADRSNYFSSSSMEGSYWVDATGGGIGGGGTLMRNRRLLQSQPLLLTSPDSSAATSSTAELSSPNGSGSHKSQQRVPNCQNNCDGPPSSKASSYQGLASLPSNERIIETINRLKYEELQRRKERIAQEHRMIIKEIRDSMSQRNTLNGDGTTGPCSSSVFYVSATNDDDDDDDDDDHNDIVASIASDLGLGMFRFDSASSPSTSLKVVNTYENIGSVSSGSEFNGTLDKSSSNATHNKNHPGKANKACDTSGKNKFAFGSAGNITGESYGESENKADEEGETHLLRHGFLLPPETGIEAANQIKSPSSGSRSRRRGTVSEENLNVDAEAPRENNELENEQSLFITASKKTGHGGNGSVSGNGKEPRKTNRKYQEQELLDRRIIGSPAPTSSSSPRLKAVISGQHGEINGWQVAEVDEDVDGNVGGGGCVVSTSTSKKSKDAPNRSSYGSSTSRTSTTSSESFSEIFARNLKRTFTVGRGNKTKLKQNQSAEDVTGNGSGVGGGSDDAPETPSRSSGGILGRLRDSSRSGFGLGNNDGGGGRSSSKRRTSSKHDTVQVSQTDSPQMHNKGSRSLSECGARGSTDDANNDGDVVIIGGKSGHHHHHHREGSFSSEEELTSINSCDNRLSSLTIGSGGSGGDSGGGEDPAEYNGPFQGRAVALVDCLSSPYDRHALRYKKGDVIDIISKKPTGMWTGKVHNQIGRFKFINVQLLPNDPSEEQKKRRSKDVEDEQELGGDEDDEEDEDGIIEGDDDSAGDYADADTSNYQDQAACSLHFGDGNGRGESENCSCPPPLQKERKRRNDHRRVEGGCGSRGNSKRLVGASWDEDRPDMEREERQSVGNVMNGYGGGVSSKRDKRSSSTSSSKQKQQRQRVYSGNDPLGREENEDGEDENDEEDDEDDDVEVEESGDEVEVDVDVDLDLEDDDGDDQDDDGVLNQDESKSSQDKDVKCQVAKKRASKKESGAGMDGSENELSHHHRKSHKNKQSVRKGRPKSVGDLLQRINLDQYTTELEKHGFESLDILKELEEEDLDTIGIANESDRAKLLTAVELLREWDLESDRIPGQTYYQFKYYQTTTMKNPKNGKSTSIANANNAAAVNNLHQRMFGQGSPALQGGGGGGGLQTGMSSPHFYRLHHPRDSGIFVGKVDGEEDPDEPISGADLSCAESHPDAETEEIILSPINLQKTSNTSASSSSATTTSGGVGGGAVNAINASNSAATLWNHHNGKPGSHNHNHINRFISKGAPPGIILPGGAPNSTTITTTSSSGPPPLIQTAQQPTSSASSSGSSSSGIATGITGDSFWNSVENTRASNGAAGVVEQQNHPQRNLQTKTQPRRDGGAPVYNTDSVRNRFLQAKSLFETTAPNSQKQTSTGNARATGTGNNHHVYENGGCTVDEITTAETQQFANLHVQQRVKPQQQNQQSQQNRFLYCEKSSDSGISVCTNSPPPMRSEYRN